MSKKELVDAIAEKAELSKKDATKALDAFVEVITETLKSGDSVRLIGFGTFGTAKRKARTGMNPRTGEKIKIKASVAPTFKAGKNLKAALN